VDRRSEEDSYDDPGFRRAVRIGKYLGPAIFFVPLGFVLFIRALGRASRSDAPNSEVFLGAGLVAVVVTVGSILVFVARSSRNR
jgi:hypothetical protein